MREMWEKNENWIEDLFILKWINEWFQENRKTKKIGRIFKILSEKNFHLINSSKNAI